MRLFMLMTVIAACVPEKPPPLDSPTEVGSDPIPSDTHDDTGTPIVPPRPSTTSNVLVVLADDLGVEKVEAYGATYDPPPTPTLTALAAEGLLFRSAYTSPQCSPTRANALTGRYGRRTGIGEVVFGSDPWGLPPTEVVIPQMLQLAPDAWDHSAVGKWHLHDFLDLPTHPNDHGFDWYSGALGNLAADRDGAGVAGDYEHWLETTNGVQAWIDTYATTETVDDAIARIDSMSEPWFLWVALHAGHDPQHSPPADLHTRDLSPGATEADRYDAAIEALDTELGRLLASLDPEQRASTTIVFFGDNGTAEAYLPHEVPGAKGTLFEPGIHVPMIVAGPGVASPGSTTDALVHSVDLFATVAEIAGVDTDALQDDTGQPVAIDGVSWLPVLSDPGGPGARSTVYAERFGPNGAGPYTLDQRTVSDGRYKLIAVEGSHTGFFDLDDPEPETVPLDLLALTVEQQAAYDRLLAELDLHVAEVVLDPRLED